MRIEQLGDGRPEVAVVGGVHGDEPCGASAIERLLEDDPTVERPVKLIVANEEALARGVRYVDADLNRAFDDSSDPGAHEAGLARRLAEELEGCLVLSLHSTRSYDEPFGIVTEVDEPARSVCPYLSIVALVVIDGEEEGRLFAVDADLIEVEAGRQGTETAAENAYRIAREFLTAAGALPGRTVGRDLPVYRLDRRVEKPPASSYEVFAENFSLVGAGEVFATADGETIVAEEDFYPILLSADGYAAQFGYAGRRVGTLSAPDPPEESP